MKHAVIYLMMFAGLSLACSDSGSGPASSRVDENDGKIYITDRTGKRWDVTHAQEKYGMDASRFQFGLGPFAIEPILEPKMIAAGDPGYPGDDEVFRVMGTSMNGETRAYPISVMSWHEVADEVFGDAHVAVAY